MRWSAIAVCACLWASACGDDGAGSDTGPDGGGDGGVDSSTPDDGVADPAPPADVILTPCPAGTIETPREGAPTECWPIAEPACAGEEVRYLGETACADIGTACPAGDFPSDAPSDAVFVLAGAAGGDGTRSAPLGTVTEGVAAAARGGTVVIGPGTYAEVVELRNPVTLEGACPGATILTSASPNELDGVLNVHDGPVVLRNLSVRDAARGGVVITGASASVSLEDVLIERATNFGVYIDVSSEATIDGLVIRDVQVNTTDGQFGDGLVVDTAATVTAARMLIESTHSTAINVLGGATLTIGGATIRDILPNDRGQGGRGISIKDGSTVTVDGLWIERTRDTALEARNADTTLDVSNAIIDDTRVDARGDGGRALTSFEDAHTSLSRVLIRGVGDVGLILGARTTVDLEDVVVRDARGDEDRSFGRLLEAFGGTAIEGRRLWFEEALELGIALNEDGTRAVLSDVTIRGIRGRATDGLFGRGINVQLGALAELHRIQIRDVRNNAVFADGSTIIAEDVDIRGVTPAEGTRLGRGLSIQLGSMVDIDRLSIADVFDVGVTANTMAMVTVDDLTIRRVTAPPCPSGEDCGFEIGGIGVGAYEGARCTVTRIAVSEAALCGVHVASEGELDIAGGRVSGSAIGACVQVDGYDIGRLDSASYADNGTPLEATRLPVPDPDSAIE